MATPPSGVLAAKPSLSPQDRPSRVIARALRDSGAEVIYTGLRQKPEMIVNAALQKNVQVIGFSIISGAHKAIVPLRDGMLRQNDMTSVKAVVDGIIPDEDARGFDFQRVIPGFQPRASLGARVTSGREAAAAVQRNQ